jgi:FkbM family methyltransferase
VRVFLDIGSHTGETIGEVAKAKYAFDKIACFEPASACLSDLERIADADPRIEVCPFGLGARTEQLELHNPGWVGASVLSTEGPTETVRIIDVADWFRSNLAASDFVVVKTNCEGAEVDIVNRLLDERLFALAVTFLITPDVRDHPEHRHKELELRKRLKASGLRNYCFSDDVMIGTTHERRIANWLSLFGIDTGKDRAAIERAYADNFARYARKTGRRHQFEMRLKEALGYQRAPDWAKSLLRRGKRLLGLSRERDRTL